MAKLISLRANKKRKLATEPRHALNAVCPYYTMFPLEYPMRILRRHRRTGLRKVLDPFCGRGTTLYAARALGLSAWGIDISPVAVSIAQAKTAATSPTHALNLAEDILAGTDQGAEVPVGEFWDWAYHPDALRQICRMRRALLGDRSEAAALLRALCLGALHGPRPKNPEAVSYFSNQMPRTFASKPTYSVKYWQARQLTPPALCALTVLKRRASRLVAGELPVSADRASHVVRGDSGAKATFRRLPADFDAVITSPPYYGMNLYVQDQWLRNWFVGGTAAPDYQATPQVSHRGVEAFTASLARVWDNVGQAGRAGLHLYVRFGSLPSRQQHDPRAILKESLADSRCSWDLVSVRHAQTAAAGYRQADHMNTITASPAVAEYDFHAVLRV